MAGGALGLHSPAGKGSERQAAHRRAETGNKPQPRQPPAHTSAKAHARGEHAGKRGPAPRPGSAARTASPSRHRGGQRAGAASSARLPPRFARPWPGHARSPAIPAWEGTIQGRHLLRPVGPLPPVRKRERPRGAPRSPEFPPSLSQFPERRGNTRPKPPSLRAALRQFFWEQTQWRCPAGAQPLAGAAAEHKSSGGPGGLGDAPAS